MTTATTCRHYANIDVTVTPPNTIEGLEDPEQLLVVLTECVPDAKYVTLVFDVTNMRALRLVDVQPWVSEEDGLHIGQQVRAAGASFWFPQDHAAFTDNGWIDVEALEGEPLRRAHR
jgi:hypothetical protein